jgi:hypothetical protein
MHINNDITLGPSEVEFRKTDYLRINFEDYGDGINQSFSSRRLRHGV